MFKIFINIFFILVAGASVYLWSLPMWDDISVLKESAKSYEDTLDKFQSIQELRDKLLKDYNMVEDSNRERLMKMLPKSLNDGTLLLIVGDLLVKNRLSLKTISFTEKGGQSNSQLLIGAKTVLYETKSLALEFNGTYEDFKNFLVDMENDLLIFDIKEISFNSASSDSKSKIHTYSFKVAIQTYWQK